jgi:hypothetical protein
LVVGAEVAGFGEAVFGAVVALVVPVAGAAVVDVVLDSVVLAVVAEVELSLAARVSAPLPAQAAVRTVMARPNPARPRREIEPLRMRGSVPARRRRPAHVEGTKP